ncbi:MAG TPA: nucleoside kinase [Clostridiales bacterium]|nr:nucleoside kinase [Clostridiales bacterium]
MVNKVTVNWNGREIKVNSGTTLQEFAREYSESTAPIVLAAKVDNKVRELSYPITQDCKVETIDLSMKDGERIYARSLVFVFIRACRELFPDCKVTIEHSFGGGLYCEVHGDFTLTPRRVERIEKQMRDIIQNDEPFEKIDMPKEKANKIFEEMGWFDKIEIMKYRPEDTISLYRCGWMTDYLFGYMVPSTGYLKEFGLKFYLPGVILQFPCCDDPIQIRPFHDNPKLFKVFRQAEKWSTALGIRNIADLNKCIEEGRGPELIRICEAYHEKQIAAIADLIAQQKDDVRLILIAGPSSSGKTTFAQRLRVQLMVNGLYPVPISMDNYFFNRDQVPVDENGEQDLESIDVIDLELFNEHMTRLIQGQEVEIPHYNFVTGKREYIGNVIKLSHDQPIIVEGIHGLNEKLTEMIPSENKYKIYISALTQLNVDDHNRIPTTDARLIRRMVRDYQFRGTPIEDTLGMWPFVRRGEERNIFPFQESADIMFNSALLYELAVLKPFILPLLDNVTEDSIYYPEVNRLKKFLKYFVDLGPADIPNNSIIREFIGGSVFGV